LAWFALSGLRHVLSWWENISVLSYVFCALDAVHAKAQFIGAICRGTFVGPSGFAFRHAFGPSIAWITYMVFVGIFLVASFIDLDSFILPDILTYPAGFLA
jgi:leader peptidase (prepilin peptidase)/N-methyltransferase